MKLAAAFVVVLAGAWWWTAHERHVTEHRLAAVASQLAGRPVGVRCQGFWAAMVDIGQRTGEVDFPTGRPPDHMFLTHATCTRLKHFLDAGSHRGLDCLETVDWAQWSFAADFDDPCERHARADSEAVNTLAHESMHLRGVQSEAQTQCLAIQADAWTVARLGGTADEGYAVTRFLLALQAGMPPEYQFSNCPVRLGGLPAIPPLSS